MLENGAGREPGSSESPGASRHLAHPDGGHHAQQREGFRNPSRRQASPHHAGSLLRSQPKDVLRGCRPSRGSTWWLLRVLTEATPRTTKAFVMGSPEKTPKPFLCGPRAVRSCSEAVLRDLKFSAVPEPRAGLPAAKRWLLQALAPAGCAAMARAAAGCVTSDRAGKTNSGSLQLPAAPAGSTVPTVAAGWQVPQRCHWHCQCYLWMRNPGKIECLEEDRPSWAILVIPR